MPHVSKLFAALAAFGMLTLIALAPSAALAHAGHKHAAPVETRANTDIAKPEIASTDIAKPASVAGPATQEVRAADLIVSHAQHHHDCGDRGCCGSGHCAGSLTALAPSSLADFSPRQTALNFTYDLATPPGLGTSGPPRPPRSFV